MGLLMDAYYQRCHGPFHLLVGSPTIGLGKKGRVEDGRSNTGLKLGVSFSYITLRYTTLHYSIL